MLERDGGASLESPCPQGGWAVRGGICHLPEGPPGLGSAPGPTEIATPAPNLIFLFFIFWWPSCPCRPLRVCLSVIGAVWPRPVMEALEVFKPWSSSSEWPAQWRVTRVSSQDMGTETTEASEKCRGLVKVSLGMQAPSFEDIILWSKCLCSPKFRPWSANSQYDGIWRWGLWQVLRTLSCVLTMGLVHS